jgi:hypothetical protein
MMLEPHYVILWRSSGPFAMLHVPKLVLAVDLHINPLLDSHQQFIGNYSVAILILDTMVPTF